MSRVIHFEIHAENPERAIAFYSAVFDWQFSKWERSVPYWLIKTGGDGHPGINGGLLARRSPSPAAGQTVNSFVSIIGVDDLDALVGKVATNGGALLVAKMPISGIGWIAYAKDTEGNVFGMMQRDVRAR